MPNHPIEGNFRNTQPHLLGRVLGSLLHPQLWWFGD
nr:MAG TPA: hypothetical protein [Caudoviricetes sp.]